ncbi:MAG TPA: ribonuclease E/G, partial [Smithellaceae bacterium]|nr:ribonuclease E/G [Smithellaceae bacterium]
FVRFIPAVRTINLMEQIKIPDNMGFIVRTAGMNRTKQEIYRDYQHLVRLWKEIKKKSDNTSAPLLIYQETDFGVRSLRDYLTPEVEEILVDDYDTCRKMRSYMKAVAPRHVKIITHYKEKVPIFERFQLEDQISIIYQERVDIKSGGYIIINPTEAMITIDVNSGRGSNKRNIEETAFKTNIEACEEIARQLRLRDLGGLIVIDFIDMMEKKNVAEVEKAFKKALSLDRARIQLSRISKFGLLELSRQKKQSTIQEISYTKCPYCKGSGLRPSLEYAALGAFRKIEAEAVKGVYSELQVILHHEIANYILNRKRTELVSLESSFALRLHLCGSGEMPWDQLEIKQTIKEKDLAKPAPAKQSEALPKTPETAAGSPEQKGPASVESPVKKKRRRSRSHRRKPAPTQQEAGQLQEPAPASKEIPEKTTPDNISTAATATTVEAPAAQIYSDKPAPLIITPAEHKETPQQKSEPLGAAADKPENKEN